MPCFFLPNVVFYYICYWSILNFIIITFIIHSILKHSLSKTLKNCDKTYEFSYSFRFDFWMKFISRFIYNQMKTRTQRSSRDLDVAFLNFSKEKHRELSINRNKKNKNTIEEEIKELWKHLGSEEQSKWTKQYFIDNIGKPTWLFTHPILKKVIKKRN